jgi:hypothetical protein
MDFTLSGWILVYILSVTLFIFLILAIILASKLIGITKDVKKVVATGQTIADKAEDITDNIKSMSTVGGVVAGVMDAYNNYKKNK